MPPTVGLITFEAARHKVAVGETGGSNHDLSDLPIAKEPAVVAQDRDSGTWRGHTHTDHGLA